MGKQFFILQTGDWRERTKHVFYISYVNFITSLIRDKEELLN